MALRGPCEGPSRGPMGKSPRHQSLLARVIFGTITLLRLVKHLRI